jgi:hypothetical protein
MLGPGRRFIAPETVGRDLNVHGGETAYVTDAPMFDASKVLYADTVTAGIVQTLGEQRVGFVVIPRHTIYDDSMAGYFFPSPGIRYDWISRSTYLKYDVFPGVERLLDTGDLYLYDVRSLWIVPR